MTLFETYKAIETVANRHPNVNSVVDDFDKLNVETAKYSAIVIQEDIHSRTDDWMTYNFILGYVDRMVDWRGDDVEIHSVAVSALNTIIDTLKKSNQFADVTSTNYNIFTKRFDAMCAGAYCSLSLSVPISNCTELESFDTLVKRFTENGQYKYRAHGAPWDKVVLDVDVQPQVDLQVKAISVDANGQYTVIADPGKTGLEKAIVTVNVPTERKPEETLERTLTANGTYNLSPTSGYVFSKAVITADIHPSARLEKEIHHNGEYEYVGDYRNASIVVEVPMKEEQVLSETLTANGSYSFTPSVQGAVFSRADLAVDVHPTESLQRSFTENGNYNINGEWKDAEIAISVHPTEQLTQNIVTNGEHTFNGEWTNAAITVDVHPESPLNVSLTANDTYTYSDDYKGANIVVDVHPAANLSKSITSNGTYEYEGEWSGASIYVDVHPVDKLTKTYTKNGNYNINGEWKDAEINVDVHPSNTLNEAITANGEYSYGGEYSGVTLNINVPMKPEDTFARTLVSNGTYTIEPTAEGHVFSGGSVIVAVPSDIHNQEKTALFISNTTTEITADSGYSGLSRVAIQVAVPDPVLQSKEVNPSLTAQTITADEGYDALERVTVTKVTPDIDPNITAGNIKRGTTILGVTGNVIELNAQQKNYTITSNGTTVITPDKEFNSIDGGSISVDVHPTNRLERVFTSNGEYNLSGEWKNAAIQVSLPLQQRTVTPTTSQQAIEPETGYEALSKVIINPVTPAIDTNIVAGNIKAGTTILGVTGTYDNQKPEETAARTYTENGTYTIKPTSTDKVITEATVTVNVPDLTAMFSRLQSTEKVFYYDGDDGADYSSIIAALPDGWTARALHSLVVDITPNEATFNVNVTN